MLLHKKQQYQLTDEQGNVVNDTMSTTTAKFRKQGESRKNVKQKQKRMKNVENSIEQDDNYQKEDRFYA